MCYNCASNSDAVSSLLFSLRHKHVLGERCIQLRRPVVGSWHKEKILSTYVCEAGATMIFPRLELKHQRLLWNFFRSCISARYWLIWLWKVQRRSGWYVTILRRLTETSQLPNLFQFQFLFSFKNFLLYSVTVSVNFFSVIDPVLVKLMKFFSVLLHV